MQINEAMNMKASLDIEASVASRITIPGMTQ